MDPEEILEEELAGLPTPRTSYFTTGFVQDPRNLSQELNRTVAVAAENLNVYYFYDVSVNVVDEVLVMI